MDCAKFDECIVSAVLVLSCGQTDRQTDRQTDTESHADAAKRFTPATVIDVSNE